MSERKRTAVKSKTRPANGRKPRPAGKSVPRATVASKSSTAPERKSGAVSVSEQGVAVGRKSGVVSASKPGSAAERKLRALSRRKPSAVAERKPGAVTERRPSVVIADDHEITRRGIRSALEEGGFDVLAEAADGPGAIEQVLAHSPDLCVLDILMPGGGLEATAEVTRRVPGTLVVMLTVSDRIDDVLAAMRAGAVGYLPKDTRPDRLPAALCGVIKGEAAFPRTLMGRMLGELQLMSAGIADSRRPEDTELSPRETQILELLRAGGTTIQIGQMLSLSPITVRRHISTGMAKLGVSDRDSALRAISSPAA